jgi:hypothetical protein
VVELVFDKSKIFRGYDGQIYFKLEPLSGRCDECSLADQAHYEAMATQNQVSEERPRRRWQGNGRPGAAPPAASVVVQAPEVDPVVLQGLRVPEEVSLEQPVF